jgi:DUF438 domain-containing protein
MGQVEIMGLLLDSWHSPVVFADNQHIIRYMNSAARRHYARFGDVTGKSIFLCHNQESGEKIREIYTQLENGAEEVLYTSNEKRCIYMRSVREPDSKLVGYYERYETPPGK